MPLTYPVDLNERYTLWDSTNGQVFLDGQGKPRTNLRWPVANGSAVVNLPSDLHWLLDVREAEPVYDPATQKIVPIATADTTAETYTHGWQVVTKTAQEQADYADQQDRITKRANVTSAIATLRQWATNASTTTVTAGNAVAVLQQVVDRLGTFFDRFADLVEGNGFDR